MNTTETKSILGELSTNTYESAVNNAVFRLREEYEIEICCVKQIEKRYFSIIYELHGNNASYILKLSTTERTCENEYEMYKYMSEIQLLSLTPIMYSKQYNYLVTIKQTLIDLPSKIKLDNSDDALVLYMYKLGILLKKLEDKTARESVFNKKEFDDYIWPRIGKMNCISTSAKSILSYKIDRLVKACDGSSRIASLATDVNLGNLHLNERDEYVLLDMGDSYIGDCYANIVGVYLSLKFGPLHQYIENKRKTEACFSSLLRGYGLNKIDKLLFNIYQVKALICMVLFIESLNANKDNVIKLILSKLSNKYINIKLIRYMNRLLKETYE